jgi:AbiU2
MTTRDVQFERELEVFRTEVAAGTQFLYAYLAVHAVAADRRPVYELLNRAPLFWNTCLAALQTAALIALGRVFDQDSAHNLDKVLHIAQDNPQIFSRAALGRRKQGNNPESPEWLDEYLRNAYEPTPGDFRPSVLTFENEERPMRTIIETYATGSSRTRLSRTAQNPRRYLGRRTSVNYSGYLLSSAHCTRHYGNCSSMAGSQSFVTCGIQ